MGCLGSCSQEWCESVSGEFPGVPGGITRQATGLDIGQWYHRDGHVS